MFYRRGTDKLREKRKNEKKEKPGGKESPNKKGRELQRKLKQEEAGRKS